MSNCLVRRATDETKTMSNASESEGDATVDRDNTVSEELRLLPHKQRLAVLGRFTSHFCPLHVQSAHACKAVYVLQTRTDLESVEDTERADTDVLKQLERELPRYLCLSLRLGRAPALENRRGGADAGATRVLLARCNDRSSDSDGPPAEPLIEAILVRETIPLGRGERATTEATKWDSNIADEQKLVRAPAVCHRRRDRAGTHSHADSSLRHCIAESTSAPSNAMSAPPAAVLDAVTAAATAGVGSSPVAVAATSAASSVAPKSPSSTQADYGPTDPKAPDASSSPPASSSPSASPDSEPTKRFLYFAYGANMSPSQLKLKAVHSHSSRKGVLRDTQLLFDLAYSSLVEPSYANLQRKSGAATHGILYELEARDMEAMDRMEGNGRSYVREEFAMDLYPGEPTLPTDSCNPDGSIRVSAYICHPNNLSKVVLKDTPPSQRYLDVLIRGAKHHGLDSKYVAWLENHPSHPLPQLHFTADQLAAIESRALTQADLEAGCWKDYMDSTPMEEWKDPLYMAIKGIVFDIRPSKYSNAWKKFNAGKCLTLFTAGRVASEDSTIPEAIEHLKPTHQAYVDATVMDFMSTYKIVGHMADRGKYAW